MKPRTSLLVVAIGNIGAASICLIFEVLLVPVYIRFSKLPWHHLFQSERAFRDSVTIFSSVIVILPALVLIFGGTATGILKHYRKIPNDSKDA